MSLTKQQLMYKTAAEEIEADILQKRADYWESAAQDAARRGNDQEALSLVSRAMYSLDGMRAHRNRAAEFRLQAERTRE